jgi:uncharacterized alpha-E superfamily protein
MLSRVAERIYWAARYLERVENTTRLIGVYNQLLLDLPKGVNIGWYNLVVLNSATEAFEAHYKNKDEKNVVKFMLADEDHPSSLINALKMVRENIRTSRDVVPPETWERINELYIYAKANLAQGVNRHQRYELLKNIVQHCQQIYGLLHAAMSHDDAWQFWRIGQNLERADMTTRILDAGASALLYQKGDNPLLTQIVWGNVLSSLSAYLPYRRAMRTSVTGPEVVRYLILNSEFPRAVNFCLNNIALALKKLPHHEEHVLKKLTQILQAEFKPEQYDNLGEPFRDHLNDLQLQIEALHDAVVKQWFVAV